MPDSPEVLGLHPNADLTYRQKSVNALLGIISMTQPKGGGGGGGGPSMEDLVYEQAGQLQSRLPPDFVEDDYKAKMQKLGGLTVGAPPLPNASPSRSSHFSSEISATCSVSSDDSLSFALLHLTITETWEP